MAHIEDILPGATPRPESPDSPGAQVETRASDALDKAIATRYGQSPPGRRQPEQNQPAASGVVLPDKAELTTTGQ